MKDKSILLKKAVKNDLINFCLATDPKYQVNWHHDLIAKTLMRALENVQNGKKARIILQLPPRHGKKLVNNTLVPTPSGFIRHGDLKIGDYVYSPTGKQVKVLNISEETDCNMRVWFSGNIFIDCHREHEWKVYDRGQQKYRILETQEMNDLDYYKDNRCRFQVDYTNPIEGKNNLLINPYLLGVWLGDGKSDSGTICFHKNDREHINRIKDLGYETGNEWGGDLRNTTFLGVVGKLKKINVFKNKHIPIEYLTATEKSRMELLRGLIDTDGSVGKDNRVRFININKRLIDNVVYLVESLGYRTCLSKQKASLSTSGIQGRSDVYTVSFSPYDNKSFGYIPRKSRKIKAVKRLRGIVNIEKIKSEKGKCIQVEGGLYSVTEHFIPTHNSELATIKFPAWALGKYPELEFIISSYSTELASEFGRKARDLMNDENYQGLFDTRLKMDTKSKQRWLTHKNGGYTATGVGGSITGRGFNIGIIDDPIKNREEADSETYRDKVWNWYNSTFYTRQNGYGAIIVILTRWHLDDLAGRLIEKMEDDRKAGGLDMDEWELITFPAVAEDDEEFRKIGEPLWESRFGLDKLNNIKNQIDVYDWSSLYQQSPILSENQEFQKDWFRYFEEKDLPKNLVCTTTVDMAISQKDTADNTVIRTVGKEPDKPNWYLLEETAGHLDPLQTIDAVFYHYEKYRSSVWIETVAYQKSLSYFIQEEQKKRQVYFIINELKRNNSTAKEIRIRGLIPLYRAGVIFHRHSDKDLEKELLQFPKGKHDDRMDALASQLEAVEPSEDSKVYQQAPYVPSSPYEGVIEPRPVSDDSHLPKELQHETRFWQ